MKALLLIAHGSRKKEANEEIGNLARELADQDESFDLLEHAFLELAEPSIEDGVHSLINQGAQEIVVLPYFLAYGAHVGRDIPDAIDALSQTFTDVSFSILSHVGATAGMKRMLLMQIQQASFRKS